MRPSCALLALTLAFAGLALPPAARADEAASYPRKKILFFSKSSGFEHSVIKDPAKSKPGKAGGPIFGLAFQILKDFGEKNNIEFTYSKDGSLFTPAYLAQFDAYFFYTTGDLTEAGTDGNPPMSPEGKAALLQAISDGKGFIGTHSASDTFHSPGNKEMGPARFVLDGDRADDYIKMIGGEFITHGAQQPSHLIVADPKFPGASAVPADARFPEEWYTLKDFAPDLHVILVQDTSGMTGYMYDRPNYPSTWARMHGKGRVFYTSLGHRDDVWQSALFQGVLQGGVNWALGRVDSDITPNLDQAAPQASVMATYFPPPPKAKLVPGTIDTTPPRSSSR